MTSDNIDLRSDDIEMAVLGSLMDGDTSGILWPMVSSLGLKPDHFAEHLNARLFERMAALLSSGAPATTKDLRVRMASDKTLAEIGFGYIVNCYAARSETAFLRARIETLKDLATRRAMVAKGRDLSAVAADMDAPARDQLAAHIDDLQSLFDGSSVRKTTYNVRDAGTLLMDRLSRIQSGESDPNTIQTGISVLDRKTGGLYRQTFNVLGGRPGMGKSAIALQIANNVAQAGGGVAYFSLEMSHQALTERLASMRLWSEGGAVNVPYSRIHGGRITPTEFRWIGEVLAEIQDHKQYPFWIEDAPRLSPADVRAKAQVIKSRIERDGRRLDVLVLDHMHLMQCPGTTSRVAELTEISGRLAALAKDLDCAVLALAQLSRSVESRDDKRPMLADLRESGSIEQDADMVLFAYRPAYYLETERHDDATKEANRLRELARVAGHLELNVAKLRAGEVGAVDLRCDMASNIIRDPAEDAVAYLDGRAA